MIKLITMKLPEAKIKRCLLSRSLTMPTNIPSIQKTKNTKNGFSIQFYGNVARNFTQMGFTVYLNDSQNETYLPITTNERTNKKIRIDL